MTGMFSECPLRFERKKFSTKLVFVASAGWSFFGINVKSPLPCENTCRQNFAEFW